MVISYRRFGKILIPEDGPIGCPETSVINDNYSLSNNQKERSSQPLLKLFMNLKSREDKQSEYVKVLHPADVSNLVLYHVSLSDIGKLLYIVRMN